MTLKTALIAAAAVAALISASPASAEQWSNINGQPVKIATVHTHLEDGDRAAFARVARELRQSVRISRTPLPYRTLAEIPDAREVGVGDCKTLSVAFRNILKDRFGFPEESLLLATADLPNGEAHMVLVLLVVDNGKQRMMAYDSLRDAVVPIEDLTREGYKWHGRESFPGQDAILLNFNGRSLT